MKNVKHCVIENVISMVDPKVYPYIFELDNPKPQHENLQRHVKDPKSLILLWNKSKKRKFQYHFKTSNKNKPPTSNNLS